MCEENPPIEPASDWHDSAPASPESSGAPPPEDPGPQTDVLPSWIQFILARADDRPGLATQASLWVPTLLAAWKAGQKALRLSQALNASFQAPDGLPWPDEASAELITSLGELFDAFPSFEALLPALAELVELGSPLLEEQHAQALGRRALTALETLGHRLLKSILDLTFFSRGLAHPKRAAEWQTFLQHLETIFDRTLEVWLTSDRSPNQDPT